MSFASPLWLLALLPWTALAVWLLWGRLPQAPVPFLPLWQGAVEERRAKWSVQPPPLALALALLAILLAILGAAGPVFSTAGGAQPMTIILDRGLTMSAHQGSGVPRYAAVAARIAPQLRDILGSGPVNLISIPGPQTADTDRDHWQALATTLPPTATDTAAQLQAGVARTLAQTTAPVVVITDCPLSLDNDRLVVVGPTQPLNDLGIVALGARTSPRPQVMLTLRNNSDARQTTVALRSGTVARIQALDLPPRGQTRSYFLDMAALGRTLTAQLSATDDVTADKLAWLVRPRGWARVEAHTALSPGLQRLIDKYTRLQPPDEDSPRLALVGRVGDLPAGEAGVVEEMSATAPVAAGEEISFAPHPLTQQVNWVQALGGAAVAPFPAGPGWQKLVSVGTRGVLAVRGDSVRQVWIGFDSTAWPASVDYVIFWKNVLDWTGRGDDALVAQPPAPLGPQWRRVDGPAEPSEAGLLPGLYSQADGTLCAVNAPDVGVRTASASDWTPRLRRLTALHEGRSSLAAAFFVAALASLLVAVLKWRRRTTAMVPPPPAAPRRTASLHIS